MRLFASSRRRCLAGRCLAVVCSAFVCSALVCAGALASSAPAAAAGKGASPPDARPSSHASSEHWRWPLPRPHIVRRFEAPPTPYSPGHRGLDLASSPGLEVIAPATGVVTFAGTVVDRPVVTLAVGEVLVSMEPVAASVVAGDRVSEGQPVGRIASGGHCGSLCLHVGVRRDGDYVSPLLYFATVERAVLLPLT